MLFTSCSKDTETQVDTTYDCKNIYTNDFSSRASKKTMKGHILFSWKNNLNDWNYSIVPNLNVKPAQEMISSDNSVSGYECLKENICKLAEGEEIFWFGNDNIETLEGKQLNLTYPSTQTVKDIQTYCDELKIKLVIVR